MNYKRSITTAALLLLCLRAGAQEGGNAPLIRATVKPAQATIGDVLEYRVNIAGKKIGDVKILLPDSRVAYPEKDPKEVGKTDEEGKEKPSDSVPLYIIHNAKKDDRSDKTITDITVIMDLSFYRPGTHRLPEVEIRDTDNARIGYKVPDVTIKAVNEKGEFQEIEPPMNLSGNYTRLLLLIAGAVALTLLGVFAYRKVRAIMARRLAEAPKVPAIVLFREELAALGARDLIERGMVEQYVFGISTVFRRFLSRQFGFDAMEMTSDEILSKLGKLLDRERYERHAGGIEKCFNLWDLSKFAEFTPSAELLSMNLDQAERIAETMYGDEENGQHRV